MIGCEYLDNFLPFFLYNQSSTIYYRLINCVCSFFLSHSQPFSHFIHNSLFRCKFNKFISFFSKKVWKSSKIPVNKRVDIPLSTPVQGVLWINEQVINRVINTLINSFFPFHTCYFNNSYYLCQRKQLILQRYETKQYHPFVAGFVRGRSRVVFILCLPPEVVVRGR